jgi:hypothetical protein
MFRLITTISLIAFHFFTATTLYATCTKEDIQFYLDKGFTQDQITQLCSVNSGGDSTPNYQPYQQQVIIYRDGGGEEPGIKDGLTKEEREAVNIIKAGGDISKLQVTPQTISYTGKTCIISVSSPNVDDRYKDCIDVDFVIQRKDLAVSASGKKLLIGSDYVILEGTIDAKPKRSWDEFPPDKRKALQRNFEWKENGKKTTFPILGDYSVTKVVNAFRTLAATYGQTDEKNQIAKVEKGQTKEEVAEPKKEKKKRWWNPFD